VKIELLADWRLARAARGERTGPGQVSEAERERLARRYTRNLDAYDFLLRGKAAFLARQPAGYLSTWLFSAVQLLP
jgi:hypothetical protein